MAVKAKMIDSVQNVANQTRVAADSSGDARVSALRGCAAASGQVGALGKARGALVHSLAAASVERRSN